jgi:NAD-dependent deacetylase
MTKIEKLTQILKMSNEVVFFGGAGVSTESNIPDFRSEKGLYRAQSNYGYPPEEMLSSGFFRRKTDIFYDYYRKNILFTEAEPNDAHYALAKLEQMGKLKAVITQNIDGLHQKAGSKEVLELHGSIYRNYCMKCKTTYSVEDIQKISGIPKCHICDGIVRPDVVLYGESLDYDVIDRSLEHISKCEVLIIGGTSLVVYPAAGFINYFKGKHLILINKDATPFDQKADLVINEPIGKVMKEIMNSITNES